jgi:hypothetical protein
MFKVKRVIGAGDTAVLLIRMPLTVALNVRFGSEADSQLYWRCR